MFRFAASSMPATLNRFGLVVMACSALALSGCGGGSRAKDYVPDRVVTFGDENSAISSLDADGYTSSGLTDTATHHVNLKGLTYTVNSYTQDVAITCTNANFVSNKCAHVDTTPAFATAATTVWNVVDTSGFPNLVTKIEHDTVNGVYRTTNSGYFCSTNTIWAQVVAHGFGKGYSAQCPLDRDGAENYAAYGAKVADISAQVAAHRGSLGAGVLVTLMAGQNDILEVYAAVHAGSMTEDSANAALQSRASTMASTVRDIISTGAKVALALTPDLGESPKAYTGGEDRALLTRLTKVFNDKLYITELGNTSGRSLAGVNPEPYTNTGTRSASYVYQTPVCNLASVVRPDGATVISTDPDYNVRVKYCNNSTLVTNGSTSTYIWADDVHFAPVGHALIGSAMATRVANQF